MTRALLRTVELDLEDLARHLLVNPNYAGDDEVLLEVYRWICSTANESGPRWRSRDRWAWHRYPGLTKQLGLDTWCPSTTFAVGASWRDAVVPVIVKAILGRGGPERWRKDHGSMRRATIPALIHKAKDRRRFVGLDRLRVRDDRLLVPQFNQCHVGARCPFGFFIIPQESGWCFGIRYGYPSIASRGSSWLAWQPGAVDDDDPEQAMPVQGDREPLGLFVDRCAEYINTILEPAR